MAENHKGGHFLFTLGIVAVVYGIIQYLMVGLGWPDYASWIVGGVLLALLGWFKKNRMS
ncbi:MAG TPA: hypothetical protein VKC89_00055 [Patescibacteria group bacterium]|nr:hypothetical protein [Patescibacteria group bacterium]